MESFQKLGLSVNINKPYSNAIASDSPLGYHSLMIELNKRVCMDEATLALRPKDATAHTKTLGNIYSGLLSV